MSGTRQRQRIGELLVENGLLTREQLEQALEMQRGSSRKLGEILIEQKFIREEEFLDCLASNLDTTRVDLQEVVFDPEVARQLPERFARRYQVLMLGEDPDGTPVIGMIDPGNIHACDQISRVLSSNIRPVLVRPLELNQALDLVYRRTDEITTLAQSLRQEIHESDEQIAEIGEDDESAANAPVIRLVNSVFQDAVQVRASDIHVEPEEDSVRIRQRVDGTLHEQVLNDKRIAAALVSRLKLMAGLDIAEKRLPQDGRFQVNVGERRYGVRLSTLPGQHGENLVMRLLDHGARMLQLSELGMDEATESRFREQVARPNGIVLVTGPTGSGKTTTLYAALSEINTPERKIITAEDPIEYQLPRINQTQINHKVGLDFARVLRAMLRQDPDVVMVGEMRDLETVEIGIRAAMTGHLVLSTLHTNNAIATVDRLIDMGVPGYKVAASLNAVVSQQLVRRVCEGCDAEAVPDPSLAAWLIAATGKPELAEHRYRIGRGCVRCHGTGYRGRIGLHEILVLDRELVNALRREDYAAFADLAAAKDDYLPIVDAGIEAAVEGRTSLAEVRRVAGEVDRFASAAG